MLNDTMPHLPDHFDQLIHKRTVQLLGGESEYRKIADQESKEVMDRWNQDTDLIGRILRAHLFLEQFMAENLLHANPKLGSIEKAKLSFAQKIELLNPRDPDIANVISGIRKLNSIRNRLAHQSKATLTVDDVAEFLRCRTFVQVLQSRRGEKFGELKPIEVLENFARFASIALSVNRSRLVAAVTQATRELSANSNT